MSDKPDFRKLFYYEINSLPKFFKNKATLSFNIICGKCGLDHLSAARGHNYILKDELWAQYNEGYDFLCWFCLCDAIWKTKKALPTKDMFTLCEMNYLNPNIRLLK